MGAMRGASMINYCLRADNAEVVAICDKWKEGLDVQRARNKGKNIAYYDNFDDFIRHDMDAVVLANYATEHAPFAIRALEAGKHVFSEVLPCQTMQEAVLLIEAVERSGLVYAYGENYCYMPAPYEMRRLYREGEIGELEYAECEYIHNGEPIWHTIAYGDPDHWRNNMYASFYCTHSIGPILHITGLRPKTVVGFEGKKTERNLRVGSKTGQFAIEMITLDNDAIIKSVHGKLYKDSIWYSMYGGKGRMETAREDAYRGGISRIYVNSDAESGAYGTARRRTYLSTSHRSAVARFGHGGSDYWSMWNFIEKIKGNPEADTIDVYEALDMFLPGLFAYRSVLSGGIPVDIPDLRDPAEREKWRNDVACTDPKVAGDSLLPCFSLGNPNIDPSVYDKQRKMWQDQLANQYSDVYGKLDNGRRISVGERIKRFFGKLFARR